MRKHVLFLRSYIGTYSQHITFRSPAWGTMFLEKEINYESVDNVGKSAN